MTREKIINTIKENNLSITDNRVNILEIMNKDHHFMTITEIKNVLPELNTKSIYNNIKQLEEVGIVESISIKGNVRYAIVDSLSHSHPIAHTYKKDKDIGHLDIPQKIYDDIIEVARKNNKEIKSIKIFLEEE